MPHPPSAARTLFPETMDTTTSTYALDRGTLRVGRTHPKAIYFGSLDVSPNDWASPVVRDFFTNFIGLTPEPGLLRLCTKRAMDSGREKPTPLASGRVGTVAYAAECEAGPDRTVRFTVRDSRDLFR